MGHWVPTGGHYFTAGLKRPLGCTGWRVSPLTLGTAALGQPYAGLPAPTATEVNRLFDVAFTAGVNFVDCAPSYNTEQTVGSAIARHFMVRVATKVQASDDIVAVIAESRKRLRRFRLDLVYVQADSIDGQSRALDILRGLQARHWLRWIGASVYDARFAVAALQDGVEVLQMPYNLLDRRLTSTRYMDASMRNRTLVEQASIVSTAIVIRSAWLRGALAGGPAPDHVKDAVRMVRRRLFCRKSQLPEVALRFALAAPAASVIIGPRTVAEFSEAVRAQLKGPLPFWRQWAVDSIAHDDSTVIDPRTWGGDTGVFSGY